jgi:hypothetical protein
VSRPLKIYRSIVSHFFLEHRELGFSISRNIVKSSVALFTFLGWVNTRSLKRLILVLLCYLRICFCRVLLVRCAAEVIIMSRQPKSNEHALHADEHKFHCTRTDE